MKKISKIAMLFLGLFSGIAANAQVKQDVKKAEHKTEEVAGKGKAAITDKKYADKVGPNGEAIYIDKHDKFYYVDNVGHKRYVKKSQLKDK